MSCLDPTIPKDQQIKVDKRPNFRKCEICGAVGKADAYVTSLQTAEKMDKVLGCSITDTLRRSNIGQVFICESHRMEFMQNKSAVIKSKCVKCGVCGEKTRSFISLTNRLLAAQMDMYLKTNILDILMKNGRTMICSQHKADYIQKKEEAKKNGEEFSTAHLEDTVELLPIKKTCGLCGVVTTTYFTTTNVVVAQGMDMAFGTNLAALWDNLPQGKKVSLRICNSHKEEYHRKAGAEGNVLFHRGKTKRLSNGASRSLTGLVDAGEAAGNAATPGSLLPTGKKVPIARRVCVMCGAMTFHHFVVASKITAMGLDAVFGTNTKKLFEEADKTKRFFVNCCTIHKEEFLRITGEKGNKLFSYNKSGLFGKDLENPDFSLILGGIPDLPVKLNLNTNTATVDVTEGSDLTQHFILGDSTGEDSLMFRDSSERSPLGDDDAQPGPSGVRLEPSDSTETDETVDSGDGSKKKCQKCSICREGTTEFFKVTSKYIAELFDKYIGSNLAPSFVNPLKRYVKVCCNIHKDEFVVAAGDQAESLLSFAKSHEYMQFIKKEKEDFIKLYGENPPDDVFKQDVSSKSSEDSSELVQQCVLCGKTEKNVFKVNNKFTAEAMDEVLGSTIRTLFLNRSRMFFVWLCDGHKEDYLEKTAPDALNIFEPEYRKMCEERLQKEISEKRQRIQRDQLVKKLERETVAFEGTKLKNTSHRCCLCGISSKDYFILTSFATAQGLDLVLGTTLTSLFSGLDLSKRVSFYLCNAHKKEYLERTGPEGSHLFTTNKRSKKFQAVLNGEPVPEDDATSLKRKRGRQIKEAMREDISSLPSTLHSVLQQAFPTVSSAVTVHSATVPTANFIPIDNLEQSGWDGLLWNSFTQP